MIDRTKLTLEWITETSKENRNADKILIEKVIRALLLVEGLVKEKIDFVLKGGTALMVLMNSTKRLSIDIDIVLTKIPDDIDNIFTDLLKEQGFTRFKLQERSTQSKIPKKHYKFFYAPIHKTKGEEESILLDILIEETNYSSVRQVPIVSSFAPYSGTPVNAPIPSREDILGDKLTAFAPNTTGIPYFKKETSMSMEIIKQLYDIGTLFDVVTNIDIIKSTFKKFAVTELVYREKSTLNEKDILDDIYDTSLCLVTRGAVDKENFEKLQTGIGSIKQFIFSESYQIEKAIVHASKAAYLSTLIKYNATEIEKFGDPLLLKEWKIEEPLDKKLNRLKKSNPEAFFYWYKIYELTKKGIS